MKDYTTPTLIEHGNIVEETRGSCSCSSECCGKKSSEVELEPLSA